MIEKTQIEKIIDAIESKEELKLRGSEIVKENKKEDWNKEVEESPYNEYFGVDIKCALAMMNAVKKGLEPKDLIRMSEHYYKIPAARTRDLLYEYSLEGEELYDNIVFIQKMSFCKKLVNTRKQ